MEILAVRHVEVEFVERIAQVKYSEETREFPQPHQYWSKQTLKRQMQMKWNQTNEPVLEWYRVGPMQDCHSSYYWPSLPLLDHSGGYSKASLLIIRQNSRYTVEHVWICWKVVEKRLKTKDDLHWYCDRLVWIRHRRIRVFDIHPLLIRRVQSIEQFLLFIKQTNTNENSQHHLLFPRQTISDR